MRSTALNWIIGLLACAVTPSLASGAGAWKGEIPAQARDAGSWETLGDALAKAGMPYGAMAASSRLLSFFGDLASKESAYRRIVDLVDEGYPLSRSDMNGLFTPGDIEPRSGVGFADSYYLAKFILNEQKGMDRWAKQYYERMSGDEVAKYQYFLALRAYASGAPAGLDEAILHLKKVLATDTGEGSGALAEKASRTLARVYFEKRQYDRAVDIYSSFLLKLNPIHPSDWLEAAWSYYYLKKFPEALGLLYNLESRTGGSEIALEKYTLRALIYRENCAVQSAEALTVSFEKDFGAALDGLKEGRSPGEFPILSRVDIGDGSGFMRVQEILDRLKREQTWVEKRLAPPLQSLARYLYDSEARLLGSRLQTLRDIAEDHAAEQLIMISEHLKFLKYDVARAKFDPDRVFAASKDPSGAQGPRVASQERSTVLWPQRGDYWRDERTIYKGEITRQCD